MALTDVASTATLMASPGRARARPAAMVGGCSLASSFCTPGPSRPMFSDDEYRLSERRSFSRRSGEDGREGVVMDKEALEHSLVRRLLDHIEHHTTDMAEDVLEVPARPTPRVLISSGSSTSSSGRLRSGPLPVRRRSPARDVTDRRLVRHPRLVDPGQRRQSAGDGKRLPPSRRAGGRRRRANAALHLSVPRLGVRPRGRAGRSSRSAPGSRACAARRKAWSSWRLRRVTGLSWVGYAQDPQSTSTSISDRVYRRAGAPRLRRLGALRRASRPPRRRQLEGHARHLPGELPLRPPAPEHPGGSMRTAAS